MTISTDSIPIWLCLGSRWSHDKQVPPPFYRVGRKGVDDPAQLDLPAPKGDFIFAYSIEGQDNKSDSDSVLLAAASHVGMPPSELAICIDNYSDEDEFWEACKRLWENR